MEGTYEVVAAIDLGTTYSGYGYSFKGSENDIKMNKNWGDLLGFQSYKTPTSVLMAGSGDLVAFGYDALETYTESPEADDTCRDLDLFTHFKMLLHNNTGLTRHTLLFSESGKSRPAVEIFSHALKYLKDHLLKDISRERKSPVDPGMIRWVITVPAIWSEEAKQFMREAAVKSGCIEKSDSEQLIIALEPEAASFYCRQMDITGFADRGKISFPPGTKYLILDCGGGTNDMVAHKVIVDHKVKEICKVSGWSHGGINVDKQFQSLFEELVGSTFVTHFRHRHRAEWSVFMSAFERCKKKVKCDGISKMKLQLSYSIAQEFSHFTGGLSIEEHIQRRNQNGVTCVRGTLILSNQVVQSLFHDTVRDIVLGVKNVFRSVEQLSYIFMVGGFSECVFLQKAIEEELHGTGCEVLVPNEAQLAIIKGAVSFGHQQDQVLSRIARRTYGFSCSVNFDPNIHEEHKRFVDDDGKIRCNDVFVPLVEIGQEIEHGSQHKQSYGLRLNQTLFEISVLSIGRKPLRPVEYVDHPDVINHGRLRIDTPKLMRSLSQDGGCSRKVIVSMTFGNTEVVVNAYDTASKNKLSTTLDFLSDLKRHTMSEADTP